MGSEQIADVTQSRARCSHLELHASWWIAVIDALEVPRAGEAMLRVQPLGCLVA
jgi:hypothetical protein